MIKQKIAQPLMVKKKLCAAVSLSYKLYIVRKQTAPTLPYAPTMPATWPVTRFFTNGTTANTAPSPACTKKEQSMVEAIANGIGHSEVMLLIK
jgi:hypothetical protein